MISLKLKYRYALRLDLIPIINPLFITSFINYLESFLLKHILIFTPRGGGVNKHNTIFYLKTAFDSFCKHEYQPYCTTKYIFKVGKNKFTLLTIPVNTPLTLAGMGILQLKNFNSRVVYEV